MGPSGQPPPPQPVATTSPVAGLAEELTDRELEVLGLICEGYSNREIADRLVVALNTVKKHTSGIFGKLGVTSRTQAIVRAHQLGLTWPTSDDKASR